MPDTEKTVVIVWKSKITGYWGHDTPIEVEAAMAEEEAMNKEHPDIHHSVCDVYQLGLFFREMGIPDDVAFLKANEVFAV